jgi:tetratricopeptide (TPR) repeat protein
MTFLGLAAVTLAFCAQEPAAYTFELENLDGEFWCTIQADQASVRRLVSELAREADVRVDGLEVAPLDSVVTVDLRRRPLNQALVSILGSIGVRAEMRLRTWTLLPEISESTDVEELRDLALVAYLRATRSFPKHPGAAGAERSQALIQEARGNHAVARNHYDTLVENHPQSVLVPEALMRAGSILMRTQQWGQAGRRFSDLLQLEREHPFEASARVDLANCTARQGDWQRALFMVDALDAGIPFESEAERIERSHVRAFALSDAGDFKAALALLDDSDRRGLTREQRRSSFELRARIHERAGAPGEAGRALLALSGELTGQERVDVLARAGDLALQAGDEVGALMAVGHIDSSEDVPTAVEAAERIRRQARERLGLDLPIGAAHDVGQRILRGERLAAEGMFGEALSLLQPLLSAEAVPDVQQRTRALLAFARCQAELLGADAAIESLRAGLQRTTTEEERRSIYIFAGELYEQADRLQEAADAYQGRL